MGSNRSWTTEEVEFLELKWGMMNRSSIARMLGRSESAVQQKGQRLGLGDPLEHMDGITISVLSKTINTHYGLIMNWVNKYGFPAKRKRLTPNRQVLYVKRKDFWEWAEENKQMIDFSRFDKYALAPEPEWVDAKRKADFNKKTHLPRPHNTPWSDGDINRLKFLVKKSGITYPEISKDLRRSHGAIKRKLQDLNIRFRPQYLDNHRKYTEEEAKTLKTMLEGGHSFVEIAIRLKRSEAGVRGKAERMGYRFRNGVPYK